MGQQESQIMLLIIHVKSQPGYSPHVPVPFIVFVLDCHQVKQEKQGHLKIIKIKYHSHFHSPEYPGYILVDMTCRGRLCFCSWTVLSQPALIPQ